MKNSALFFIAWALSVMVPHVDGTINFISNFLLFMGFFCAIFDVIIHIKFLNK